MSKLWTIVLCMGLLTSFAVADDVLPPDWRGQPGTVTAAWDNWGDGSSSSILYTQQQVQANPGWGQQFAFVAQAGWSSSVGVLDSVGERTSVLEINHPSQLCPVGFGLRNYQNDNEEKLIRIQITYLGPGVLDFYIGTMPTDPVEFPPPIALDGWHDAIAADAYQHDDGWTTTAYDITLYPNPAYEGIGLNWGYACTGTTFIDQVVIDTWCVPEPASLSLLALGGLALLRRRR